MFIFFALALFLWLILGVYICRCRRAPRAHVFERSPVQHLRTYLTEAVAATKSIYNVALNELKTVRATSPMLRTSDQEQVLKSRETLMESLVQPENAFDITKFKASMFDLFIVRQPQKEAFLRAPKLLSMEEVNEFTLAHFRLYTALWEKFHDEKDVSTTVDELNELMTATPLHVTADELTKRKDALGRARLLSNSHKEKNRLLTLGIQNMEKEVRLLEEAVNIGDHDVLRLDPKNHSYNVAVRGFANTFDCFQTKIKKHIQLGRYALFISDMKDRIHKMKTCCTKK